MNSFNLFGLAYLKPFVILLTVFLILSCSVQRQKAAPLRTQNPSPMVEQIRVHERVKDTAFEGQRFLLEGVLPKPVVLYVPPNNKKMGNRDVLIHFNGASYVPIHAVNNLDEPPILAVVHLGSGSSVYEKPFRDPKIFNRLMDTIKSKLSLKEFGTVYCSAFSAGYGAMRILSKTHFDEIDGILLLDGLHTDYIPQRTPVAQGGQLNSNELQSFLHYAKSAVKNDKKMIITHSEIFPGTFSSTTETSDWLIKELGLKRTPVLKWGPMGMQQIAKTESGLFQVLAFAGNSAPDHLDHFHGMQHFLEVLME